MRIVFDRFRHCLGGATRTDWNNVVQGLNGNQVKLKRALIAMFARVLGEDAEDNLQDYMERTKKPKSMKAKDWVQRICRTSGAVGI